MGSPWNLEFIDIHADYECLTVGAYSYVIESLRRRLEARSVFRTPVLPAAGNVTRWYEIRLYLYYPEDRNNPVRRVRLRLRRHDLYLCAYQINERQWQELGVEGGRRDIQGSNLLGFNGSYNDLYRMASRTDTFQLRVGQGALIRAAQTLTASANKEEIARALLVMIYMFCESVRFIPVQAYMERMFFENQTIPRWIATIVNRWDELSGYVMYQDTHPNAHWDNQTLTIEGSWPSYQEIDVVTRTVWELLKYMGILLDVRQDRMPRY